MVNLLGIPVGVMAALWLGALMRYLAARLMGMNVERVAIGVGSRLWRSSSGSVELRAFPITLLIYIAGQDEIDRAPASDDPRSWWRRAAWRRLFVIIAGPVGSYLAAGLLMASSFAIWGAPVDTGRPRVDEVVEGGPASAAGLRSGDALLSIDGKAMRWSDEVVPAINDAQTTPIEIVVSRDGVTQRFLVEPRLDDASHKRRIGVAVGTVVENRSPSLVAALRDGFGWTRYSVDAMAGALARPERVHFSGPIGIMRVKRPAAGPPVAAVVAAWLAICVAFYSFTPFPPLPGGNLMLLVGGLLLRRRPGRRFKLGLIITAAVVCSLGVVACTLGSVVSTLRSW